MANDNSVLAKVSLQHVQPPSHHANSVSQCHENITLDLPIPNLDRLQRREETIFNRQELGNP